MKTMLLAFVSSSLLAATGVGLSGAEPSDPSAPGGGRVGEAQPTGAGCTLLRPLSWNVNGRTCLESPTTSLPMVDGQEYTAYSKGGRLFGLGETTVRCENGGIVTVRKTCFRDGNQ